MHFATLGPLAEAKVDELHKVTAWRIVKEVLELQVAMGDALVMQVVHGKQHLPGSICSLCLSKDLLLHGPVKELSTRHNFHDQANLIVCQVDMHDTCNMRVVHEEAKFHFVCEQLLLLWHQIRHQQVLDSEFGTCVLLFAHIHGPIHASAQHLGGDFEVVFQPIRESMKPALDSKDANLFNGIPGSCAGILCCLSLLVGSLCCFLPPPQRRHHHFARCGIFE
mmetsp:Transcript_38727/g.69875  ORF Transcript_38727/g.69875 Transcript_38727/m.69875 type:complete len:222 (+) Transcript_38727:244-909(+)